MWLPCDIDWLLTMWLVPSPKNITSFAPAAYVVWWQMNALGCTSQSETVALNEMLYEAQSNTTVNAALKTAQKVSRTICFVSKDRPLLFISLDVRVMYELFWGHNTHPMCFAGL